MKCGSVRRSMWKMVPRSSGIRRSGTTFTPSIAVRLGWSAAVMWSPVVDGRTPASSSSHPQIVRGAPIDRLEHTFAMPSDDIEPANADRHQELPATRRPPERTGARRRAHLRQGRRPVPGGPGAGHRPRPGRHVWDVDGNEYVEYGSGLRAVALGHAHPPVIERGRAATGPRAPTSSARPRLSSRRPRSFLEPVRRADMVKFAKNGSDATTAAVRLARAVTGRDMVAICHDQPFFSTDDWFIGRPRCRPASRTPCAT